MRIPTRLLLLTSLLAAPGVIPLYLLYRTTSQPGSAIVCSLGLPPALRESKLTHLLNPRGNPWLADTWTYRVRRSQIPSLAALPASELSEEQEERIVLARFVRGFFGGKAFAFERWLFNTVQPVRKYLDVDIIDPSNHLLTVSSHEHRTFWSPEGWPKSDYATYGSAFLNAFLLLDTGRERIYADDRWPRTYSAIAFGSNRPTSRFVGAHYFTVTRNTASSKSGDGDDVVFELSIWSFNTDPSEDGKNGARPRWFWKWVLPRFHYMYERALMADGIDAVCN